MRYFITIFLSLITLLLTVAASFLVVDGNLAQLTGWYHFEKGGKLFEGQNADTMQNVDWMRIQDLHSSYSCEKREDGTWWITSPFEDRMSPIAIQSILSFTEHTRLVDTLPLNNTTKRSLREFGVETRPYELTLKVPTHNGHRTTVARYTIGSESPWLADAMELNKVLPTCYLRTNFYGNDERIHVVTGNLLPVFKNGLHELRDHHLLQLIPEQVYKIEIQGPAQDKLVLQRLSTESPWIITSPLATSADQDLVNTLANNLCYLRAINVQDTQDVQLPEGAETTRVTLTDHLGQPTSITLYPPQEDSQSDMTVQMASVSDRPVLFTLQAAPRIKRKGDYAPFINAVFQLPVLPEADIAKIRTGNVPIYTEELKMDLEALRSKKFSEIDKSDIVRIALRSSFSSRDLRLLMIPGDAESQVQDKWMFSLGNSPFQAAENGLVNQLLTSLNNIPIEDFVEDIPLGANFQESIKKYGLNQPDYILSLLPRPYPYRANIFGLDIPLLPDRSSITYIFKRYQDPQTQESYWLGCEWNGSTIAKLSPKLTRNFSMLDTTWKDRQVLNFPRPALRTITLNYAQDPLVLHYDYIGESWTGSVNGKDVTPNINPYRAQHYIQTLHNLRAHQWLNPDDTEALRMLQNPVFSVTLDLEISKISNQDAVIISQSDVDPQSGPLTGTTAGNKSYAKDMLTEKGTKDDQAMRDFALTDYVKEKKSITLEIAPVHAAEDTMFYGRIVETGELFILPQEAALSLGAGILDL